MTVELNLNRPKSLPNISGVVKNNKTQSFGNGIIASALIASDANPMVGISIIDLVSMIGPRTIVDATRNGFAATETFLRESAGLIINCLIPSVIVYGMGKLVEKHIMGKEFADFKPSKFWANQKTNEALTSAWLSTDKTLEKPQRIKAFVSTVLENIEGLAGKGKDAIESGLPINDGYIKIKDLANKQTIYENLANAIANNDKNLLDNTTAELIKNLHASKKIRFISNVPFAALEGVEKINLGSNAGIKNLIRDMNDMGPAFSKIADANIPAFSKKLTKLINTKSFAGLGVVVTLAASFQFFNRMLTKYRTGSSEFVGEKDYVQKVKEGNTSTGKEISANEKSKLNRYKFLGVLGMGLLAIASFKQKLTLNMFQFNGSFPTMDQCRAITAVTNSGRILSSANENELKESALRDTCTFVNLYYLGDYVSKGFAAIKEKFGDLKGELLNETAKLKDNATVLDKFIHWFKHTELKAFEELSDNPSIKNNRAFAQASGLLYSCIVLGLIVPLYNKHRTNKKAIEKQIALETAENTRRAIQFDSKKLYTSFFQDKLTNQ